MKRKGIQKPQTPVWSFLLGIIFLLIIPFQTLADEEYRFERMWPTLQQPWYFNTPVGIAIAPDGSVYVADK